VTEINYKAGRGGWSGFNKTVAGSMVMLLLPSTPPGTVNQAAGLGLRPVDRLLVRLLRGERCGLLV